MLRVKLNSRARCPSLRSAFNNVSEVGYAFTYKPADVVFLRATAMAAILTAINSVAMLNDVRRKRYRGGLHQSIYQEATSLSAYQATKAIVERSLQRLELVVPISLMACKGVYILDYD